MPRPSLLLAMLLIGMASTGCGAAKTGSNNSSGSSQLAPTTSTDAATATQPASGSQASPPGPDYYISTFGHEASEPDKAEITSVVDRYYAAVLADDGTIACTLITPELAKGVPEDYGRAPNPAYMRGTTCPQVLSGLFKSLDGQNSTDLATTKVTGVRLMDNHGFAQLSSKTTPTAQVAVVHEGTKWKLSVVIGKACINCASGPNR